MGVFQWKGIKPVPPMGDEELAELNTAFGKYADDDWNREVDIAVASLLFAKFGDEFTPEFYRLLRAEADQIAALLVNDAFLPLTADETLTLALVHFDAFLDISGFGVHATNGVENVLAYLVMSSLLLAQIGRGMDPPTKEAIDDLRVQVADLHRDGRALLPREHVGAILSALETASRTHAQAVRTYTGGKDMDPLDPMTAVRVA